VDSGKFDARRALFLFAMVVLALAPWRDAQASRILHLLHSFCAETNCVDGDDPEAGLVMDSSGNLYGTSYLGGVHNSGTVFELDAKSTWHVLYSFCSKGGIKCTDGRFPIAGLILDASGNLYGTTETGGTHNNAGTVFELSQDGNTGAWSERVLYGFCALSGAACIDGENPAAGLIMGGAGNLYGTTESGGVHGHGTAFELTLDKTTGTWSEKVLYSFCSEAACLDGSGPRAGLLMDRSGNLYGTTEQGGAYRNGGTVFELTRNQTTGRWSEKVLHSFCARVHDGSCRDGAAPLAALIMDQSGNLYGTTFQGGPRDQRDNGVVFELVPNPSDGTWNEQILYTFCASGPGTCFDGVGPIAGLIMDGSGNLYGTTEYSESDATTGTVFELTRNGKSWTETVLWFFCDVGDDACLGSAPLAGVILDSAGNLYGTTSAGGAYNSGVVFELEK
jgi:uncharacterized repeat protein (TIGR03803 family)